MNKPSFNFYLSLVIGLSSISLVSGASEISFSKEFTAADKKACVTKWIETQLGNFTGGTVVTLLPEALQIPENTNRTYMGVPYYRVHFAIQVGDPEVKNRFSGSGNFTFEEAKGLTKGVRCDLSHQGSAIVDKEGLENYQKNLPGPTAEQLERDGTIMTLKPPASLMSLVGDDGRAFNLYGVEYSPEENTRVTDRMAGERQAAEEATRRRERAAEKAERERSRGNTSFPNTGFGSGYGYGTPVGGAGYGTTMNYGGMGGGMGGGYIPPNNQGE